MSVTIPEVAGLATANNFLSRVPRGALWLATNCSRAKDGIIEPARGFKSVGYNPASSPAQVDFFQDHAIIQYGSSLAYDTGSAFTVYSGSYSPPLASQQRMKFALAMSRLYFSTTTGTKTLTAYNGTPISAGMPRAYIRSNGTMTGNPNAAGTWFRTNTQVAYRAVIMTRDSNGERYGPPSDRFVIRNPSDVTVAIGSLAKNGTGTATATVANTFLDGQIVALSPGEANFAAGNYTLNSPTSATAFSFPLAGGVVTNTVAQTFSSGTKNVQLNVLAPIGAQSTQVMRLYRTPMSASETTDPGEDYFLVAELTVGSVPGTVSFTDTQPETLLGDPLYTNANIGGVSGGLNASRYPPPIAKDICAWDRRLWCLNTTSKQRLYMTLIGVGAPNGIQTGDTVTLGSEVYTATTDFQLTTRYDAATNVQMTAQDLVRIINQNSTGYYAYYISSSQDVAGKIYVEEKTIGGGSFTGTSSRTTAWSQVLSVTSDPGSIPNGGWYSEQDQPEAFPTTNYFTASPQNWQVLRGIPLRDRLILMAENGVYTVTGATNYRFDLADSTARLVGPDTAVALNNQVFALTSQGVVSISDAGVRIISRAIEDIIQPLIAGPALATVKQYAFGVAYETEREYELWLPAAAGDTYCKQAYVYNVLTDSWTKKTGDRLCGRVHPSTDLKYMGHGSSSRLLVERKSFDRFDNAGDTTSVTINSHTGTSATLASATGVSVGDMLWQSNSLASTITAINGSVLTVADTLGWSNAAAEVRAAIAQTVEFAPQAEGAPSTKKQFGEVSLHFRRLSSSIAPTLYVWSDTDPTNTTSAFKDVYAKTTPVTYRQLVAAAKQMARTLSIGFSINEAGAQWALMGYTLGSTPLSDAGSK